MSKNKATRTLAVVSIEELDAFFDHLQSHTSDLLPDGILEINVKTLHTLHLLSEETPPSGTPPASTLLQAIESEGKITLYNEKFALWVAPQKNADPASTIVFIASRKDNEMKPEIAFRTTGIHNRSKTILKLIDRLLADIQETENVISKLEGPQSGTPPKPDASGNPV
jgi:hypothetical protein